MKTLKIGSVESLEVAVAECVRWKIELTKAVAFKDAEVAIIERTHQPRITSFLERIQEAEEAIQDYCKANREWLFVEKKSRETNLAEFGFELTPYRVEREGKLTWKDVVKRLNRLKAWGRAYVRKPEPQPDKQALLTDRNKLTEAQLTAAGIRFERDEQFFIRPKPESAGETVRKAA